MENDFRITTINRKTGSLLLNMVMRKAYIYTSAIKWMAILWENKPS